MPLPGKFRIQNSERIYTTSQHGYFAISFLGQEVKNQGQQTPQSSGTKCTVTTKRMTVRSPSLIEMLLHELPCIARSTVQQSEITAIKLTYLTHDIQSRHLSAAMPRSLESAIMSVLCLENFAWAILGRSYQTTPGSELKLSTSLLQVVTQRRSVAKSVGCFQWRLFVR